MEQLLTLYSEVQSTDVRWLWYPFIAIGKITLLQGDPGDGKSTMMMNLIAELSTGGKTPDGCKVGVPQKVIYQCSEDDASDTIKPRLERCGADCRKIAFINFRPAKPTPSIYDSNLKRVAVYTRVSTSSEEQISSIENQTLYYTKKIAETENWTLQNIYSDEGKSGTSLRKRDAFKRIITYKIKIGDYNQL